jgi:uncharacterized protein (TIGR02246 family)
MMRTALLLLWLVAPSAAWAQADTLATVPDTTVAPSAAAADAVTTVRALEAARLSALVAGDTGRLAGIIAPDATYVHSNGLVQSRDALFAMLERGEIRYLSVTPENPQYRAYDGTVIGTGVQNVEVKSGGKSMVMRNRYTVVYATTPDGWRMVAYQSTAMPKVGARP